MLITMANPLAFGINFAQMFGMLIIVIGIVATVTTQLADSLDAGEAKNAVNNGTAGLSKFAQQQELIGLLGGLAIVIGILFFALGGMGGGRR